MATVLTTDQLTELSKVFELFFKGLTECGLLSKYLVKFQGAAVDFSVQVKYQDLLLQFIRSLQNLVVKIPSVPGHEYTKDFATQTTQEVNLIDESVPEITNLTKKSDVETDEWANEGRTGSAIFIANNRTPNAGSCCLASQCYATDTAQSMQAEGVDRNCNGENSVLEERSVNTLMETETSINRTPAQTTENSLENITIAEFNSVEFPSIAREFSSILNVTSPQPLSIKAVNNELSKLYNGTDIYFQVMVASPELISPFPVPEMTNEVEDRGIGTTVEGNGDERADMGSALYMCSLCNITFPTLDGLDIHTNLKHCMSSYYQPCPQDSGSEYSLHKYCNRENNGRDLFRCSICSRYFLTTMSYHRHMAIHGNKKKGVCKVCGKAFNRLDYLQKHYRTHNGHRPYRCNFCPSRFISPSLLRLHQKMLAGARNHKCHKPNKQRHLENKRFHCTMCKKDYAEKRDLTKHLIIHIT